MPKQPQSPKSDIPSTLLKPSPLQQHDLDAEKVPVRLITTDQSAMPDHLD